MSTIHSLQMAAVDLENRVVREMQFSGDAQRQVADAFTTLREALNQVETLVMNTFQERGRALAAALGSGKPTPDTYDQERESSKDKIAPKAKFGKTMVVSEPPVERHQE